MAFPTKLSKAALDKLGQPKLKLFLSVDVVGSTAFKQSGPWTHQTQAISKESEGGNWLLFLTSFYKGFGNKLNKHLSDRITETGLVAPTSTSQIQPPKLWKALGDELVFVALIEHEAHLPVILDAFRHALNEEIDRAKDGARPLPISFKGTAWTAGFPVCNAEIPMAPNDGNGGDTSVVMDYDYAGPAIDIGFRLTSLATPKRLSISAEIAYMLATLSSPISRFVHPVGPVEFKGVLGGRDYPAFWLDCFRGVKRTSWLSELRGKSTTEGLEALSKMEEKMLPKTHGGPDEIKEFLREWFSTTGSLIVPPFVHATTGSCVAPTNYIELLEMAQAELGELYRADQEGSEEGAEKANESVRALSAEGSESV
jgi:hypothetical protein